MTRISKFQVFCWLLCAVAIFVVSNIWHGVIWQREVLKDFESAAGDVPLSRSLTQAPPIVIASVLKPDEDAEGNHSLVESAITVQDDLTRDEPRTSSQHRVNHEKEHLSVVTKQNSTTDRVTSSRGYKNVNYSGVWVPPTVLKGDVNNANLSSLVPLINNETRCEGDYRKNPFLFMPVTSAADEFLRRKLWRSQWSHFRQIDGKRVTYMFIVAKTNDASVQRDIQEESRAYGDILQLNYTDKYAKNIFKTVGGLHWIHNHCSHAKYVLKADSDAFVNVPSIIDFLVKRGNYTEPLYAGFTRWDARPNRKNFKWSVTEEEFPFAIFPPVVYGFAVLMSQKTAREFYQLSFCIRYFRLDDVYLAMLAKTLGMIPLQLGKFALTYVSKLSAASLVGRRRQPMVIHTALPADEFTVFWNEFHNSRNKPSS